MSTDVRQVAPAAHTFDVVTHLVAREFRLRYRRAFVGWAWAVAEPLARLAVFAVVFRHVLEVPTDGSYPVFLYTGLLAWDWFASGLTAVISSPIERRTLLLRPQVPRRALPIVSVLSELLDLLAALPVLLVFLLFQGGIPATILLLPVVLAGQLLLILGIGYPLAAANVFARDVKQLAVVVLRIGFYVTPVLYAAEQLPERFRRFIAWNPVAYVVDAYRAVLVDGRLPSAGFAVVTAVSAVALVLGVRSYDRAAGSFADEL